MKKLNIVSFNFDFKVKIVMIVCIIIAVVIIAYSFYNICVENGVSTIKVAKLEDFVNINSYEAEYDILVNSNKNSNTYTVKEVTDMLSNSYNYLINNEFAINIKDNEIKLSKANIAFEYSVNMYKVENNNFISFSSIIEIVRDINNSIIPGTITQVEENENIIYKIHTDEEIIKKISDIEINISKNENKIININMYSNDKNQLYSIRFISFIVKN